MTLQLSMETDTNMNFHSSYPVQIGIYDLIVVGAGISGISTALEAAETGFKVLLIEKNPYIGGRVTQLNQYFPKLCPPTCGLEINLKRLKDNRNIELLTLAEPVSIEGKPGNYKIKINQKPRFVNERCTACGDCVGACPVSKPNDFNYGMDENKAVYLAYDNAYPAVFSIDKKYCLGEKCGLCVETCKYNAIDLKDEAKTIDIEAKAIVWASGWKPYDAKNLETLGFGKYNAVITNVMLERLAAPNGPTQGEIKIKGLNNIQKVAFVQCAGSRDENHLEFCSSVCCLASMKQARFVREQFPNAEIYIFYIDLRTPGFFEDFYTETKKDDKIYFRRGKVAKVFEDIGTKSLIVEAENTLEGKLTQTKVNLVVLATGMQPTAQNNGFPYKAFLDKNGFIKNDAEIIGCGVAASPKDVAAVVQESTGAAMRAIHIIKGRN